MVLSAWIRDRERAALGRVRVSGLCLCLVLLVAAGWLGWRESRLADLPLATKTGVAAQIAGGVKLQLKQLSMVIYLAKVNWNALLEDILGNVGAESGCHALDDLRSLPADTPCFSASRTAMGKVWAEAFGSGGSPLSERELRDPWNSPFVLNLSEKSCGKYGTWCPEDTVSSVGPDGRPNTADDIGESVPQHLGPAVAAQTGK